MYLTPEFKALIALVPFMIGFLVLIGLVGLAVVAVSLREPRRPKKRPLPEHALPVETDTGTLPVPSVALAEENA